MAETCSFYQNFCIEWNVENYTAVEKLESEHFYLDGAQWKLIFESSFIDCRRRYRFKLQKIKPVESLHEFLLKSYIEDVSRKRHLAHDAHLIVLECFPVEIRWLWGEDFCQKNKEPLVDNALTFVFAFKCVKSFQTNANIAEKTSSNLDMECLSLELSNVLESGHLSDVQLKCIEETTTVCKENIIPAHRIILSARSQVFKKMLESDMSESLNRCINIVDMDISTLKQLLQYLYTGKLSDLSSDTAHKLYNAADKYAIDSLKKHCTNFLLGNLTEENACEYLVLADGYNNTEFKDAAINYIVEHGVPLKAGVWSKFCKENNKLALEVLSVAYVATYSHIYNK